jgi:Gpi18-like mannosyltransferase
MKMRSAPSGLPALVCVVALFIGAAVRFALRGYTTSDTYAYLLPWYAFVRDHGFAALGSAFNNYAPFYSYLLLAVARLDGLADNLTLIKSITWTVELANAVLAGRLVLAAGATPLRAALASAAVWLAPTVLFNGAAWGQIDSLWCFFTLLSVSIFISGRDGTPAFGAAFATKAQGAFLGPFVVGQVLRGRVAPWGLAWVPGVYIAAAIPALLAGRPLADILRIYLDQGRTFHGLSMNAASIWAILGDYVPYTVGSMVGLAIAAAAGFALAKQISRTKLDEPAAQLVAAAASLLLMPLLLPKMHDRFFYAFEVTALILAAVDLRHLPLALGAQATGLAPYLAIQTIDPRAVKVAAVVNVLLCCKLLRDLSSHAESPLERAAEQPGRPAGGVRAPAPVNKTSGG